MRKASTLLFALLIVSVSGQSVVNLSGKVLDENGEGLEFALVALFDLPDSNYVKSEFTDIQGVFNVVELPQGEYVVQVDLLGYSTEKKRVVLGGDDEKVILPTITLVSDAELLGEVTITSKVPYVERKIDRVVVTPDALISNAGNNALEVLERAPGISLNSDGSLMLRGRSGVTVFINDKPSYLSGDELQNYLMSLPAGSIKQVEIMTNPPAKYEAAGNSGVINIITKRSGLMGFNGNVSLSYRQGRYSRSNNSLNLTLNKNKVSIYTNIFAGYWNSFQDLNINRYYRDENGQRLSAFEQNSFNRNNGRYLNARLGVDYYVSDRTTFGAAYKYVDQLGERNVDNTSLISDAGGDLEQRVVADNDSDRPFGSGLVNFYVAHDLDTIGSSISMDADYVKYTSGNEQLFYNFSYDASGQLTFDNRIDGEIPGEISIYAARSDYTQSFESGARLEAGLKSALTKTDNEAIYSTTVEGETAPDYDLSNRFLYDEWINAGYLNYTRTVAKVDLQAGLRLESTELTGDQLGNEERTDTSFTREYTALFPTFYASTRLDSAENHTLTFSYGRRINRPYFQSLNPFVSPLDRFTFYSGNPDLLPTYAHNLELSHSYKGTLNTSLTYASTVDGINETLEIREGIYYSRPGNIASSESLTLSVDVATPIAEWYDINGYVELGHLRFDSDLYTEQLNSSGTYYYLSATNNFKFGKGWKADISARHRSDIVSAQLLIKSYSQVDVGAEKQILNDRGSLKLSVQDVFYTRRGDGIINNLRLTDADWNSTYDSRIAALTFSYRFGSTQSNKRSRNSSGSEEEQGRVRG